MELIDLFKEALETELIALIIGLTIGISFLVARQYNECKRLNKAIKKQKNGNAN